MSNRYWVGNSGNWNDTNHWSTSSGGAGGASVPGSTDDVIFDSNSFSSAGQTVTLDVFPNIQGFDSSAATNSPTLAMGTFSMNFNPNAGTITVDFRAVTVTKSTGGSMLFYDGTTNFNPGGNTFKSIDYSALNTTVSLQGALDLTGNFIIDSFSSSAVFTSNNYAITVAGNLLLDSDATTDFGSSTLTVAGDVDVDYNGNNTNNLTASSATIVMTGLNKYFYMNSSQTIGTLSLQNSVNPFYATGGTITTLNLTAGKTYTVDVSGSNDTINVTNFNAVGTLGNLITLLSGSAGIQFTFSKPSGVVTSDYLHLTDSNAAGGASWYAGSHSTDNSNNDGWLFEDPPILPVDASWAFAAGNTTLTQLHIIQTQDASWAFVADNVGLIQNYTVVKQDALWEFWGDNTTLQQNHIFSPVDASWAFVVDAGSVEPELEPVDASWAFVADNTTLVIFRKPFTAYTVPLKPTTAYV